MAGDDSTSRIGRLATFALILAGLFASAYALGERLPGHSHTGTTTVHDHSDMDHSAPIEPDLPAGVDGDYRLVESLDEVDGTTHVFHIEDGNGDPVADFDLVHGALLHVVLVRPDLSDFVHVHPALGVDGSFDVGLPAEGTWHVVFESTPTGSGGTAVVLSTDLSDGTTLAPLELPAPSNTATANGADGTELRVTLSTTSGMGYTFTVTDVAGNAVEGLEPYLEQAAHLVVLRAGDLAYAHLHPMSEVGDPAISFGGTLPAGGTYRAFLQFGWAGDVVTVPFTIVT